MEIRKEVTGQKSSRALEDWGLGLGIPKDDPQGQVCFFCWRFSGEVKGKRGELLFRGDRRNSRYKFGRSSELSCKDSQKLGRPVTGHVVCHCG